MVLLRGKNKMVGSDVGYWFAINMICADAKEKC